MNADYRAALGAARLAGEVKRHRHVWERYYIAVASAEQPDVIAVGETSCRCGVIRDDAKSSLGKSSRRLGNDNERRLERLYGPTKVGEYGDPVDLIGKDWVWQAKASRGAPPLWLSAVDAWTGRLAIPTGWEATFRAMEPIRRDRAPLLIRSYVRSGVPTRDWIVVRSSDWADLHGISSGMPWLVMTGAEFLAINGTDSRREQP
jgi:hypothetical protein